MCKERFKTIVNDKKDSNQIKMFLLDKEFTKEELIEYFIETVSFDEIESERLQKRVERLESKIERIQDIVN